MPNTLTLIFSIHTADRVVRTVTRGKYWYLIELSSAKSGLLKRTLLSYLILQQVYNAVENACFILHLQGRLLKCISLLPAYTLILDICTYLPYSQLYLFKLYL